MRDKPPPSGERNGLFPGGGGGLMVLVVSDPFFFSPNAAEMNKWRNISFVAVPVCAGLTIYNLMQSHHAEHETKVAERWRSYQF